MVVNTVKMTAQQFLELGEDPVGVRLELVNGEVAMEGPPHLAVEVISPSSLEIDREDKFNQYRNAGVSYYWMVDPQLKSIDAWHLKRGRYVSVGRRQGIATVTFAPFANLEISLSRLWRK